MGNTNSATQQASKHKQSDAPLALAPFCHPIMLQGLAGSGKRSVQRHMHIPAARTLTVEDAFLTSPPIYGMHWNGNNSPDYAHAASDKSGRWDYGGR